MHLSSVANIPAETHSRSSPLDEVFKVLLDQETDLVFDPGNGGDICGPCSGWHLIVFETCALVVAGRTKAF